MDRRLGALGVSYWNTNVLRRFSRWAVIPDAWTVLVDRRQQVWAGTRDEGLYEFQTNQFRPRDPARKFSGRKFLRCLKTVTASCGLARKAASRNFDGQKWKLFTTRDGLSGNAVRAIAQDADGNLWIGTENHGLNYFANGKFVSCPKIGGRPARQTTSPAFMWTRTTCLWVGTYGHGLARLQNGKWTSPLRPTNGLASDSISYVIEDAAGDLWIGSNMGLMRIQKKSLDDFAAGKTSSVSCRTYGKTDGLPDARMFRRLAARRPARGDGKLCFPNHQRRGLRESGANQTRICSRRRF